MQRIYIFAGLLVVLGVFGFISNASALSIFDITYPIPELGDCQDQGACKTYCDDFSNANACLAFAEKFGIQVTVKTEQVQALQQSGPGGCKGESECQSYCEDVSHLDECIEFGRANGFISDEEYQEVKNFQSQTGPGGCKGAGECRAYCDDASHQEECLDFGNRQGLISDKDLEVARSLQEQGGPGGCKTSKECKDYCSDPSHINECVDSAVEHGFMTADEAQRVKKFAVIEGPGGCVGEACRDYCEDPSHQEECIAFAEQNGLMSPEEAAIAKKVAGKTGPGGCRGRECQTYCDNADHAEECLAFAEENGLIPQEELQQAKKFLQATQQGGPGGCKGRECRDYCEDPGHQEECFNFAKGQGLLRPEDEQKFETGRKILAVVQTSGGPGGCKSEQECQAYCGDPSHGEECIAFGATHGGIPEEEARKMLKEFTEGTHSGPGGFRPPEDFRRFEEEGMRKFEEFRALEQEFRGRVEQRFGPQPGGFPGGQGSGFAGPGGCTSPAECIKYCSENKSECFSFGGPGKPGATPPQGGVAPGREFDQGRSQFRPQLRENLKIEFHEGDLPEFQSEEQKKEFFQQNFNNLRENITNNVSEEQRKQIFEQQFQQFRGGEFPGQPPEGFRPPEGSQGQFEQQFQGEFQRQVDQQFQQEFQRQVEQQTQQFPTGEFKPPEGQFLPPPGEQFTPPPESFTPPPETFVAPPPPTETTAPPPPEGGSLIDAFKSFFRR
ncbi:MAG: hypothetical protein HYW97_01385 [Candidatus Wildermuthbacteria bacterium]|nr:hypothetical protein [Candidatus Wildermuthbacteria bacterium]